jgi:hypothetical protein
MNKKSFNLADEEYMETLGKETLEIVREQDDLNDEEKPAIEQENANNDEQKPNEEGLEENQEKRTPTPKPPRTVCFRVSLKFSI